jgi:hypothetical protein
MIQQDALETREFTTNLMVRSKAAMVVGVKGISNNSGDHCRRGTTQFTASRASPFDCLHQNDIIGKALLLGHSMELGVVFINSSVTNSGELPLFGGDDREILRGMEMAAEVDRV